MRRQKERCKMNNYTGAPLNRLGGLKLGRYKLGAKVEKEEIARDKAIKRAVMERQQQHKQKVMQDMAKYRINRERLAAKVAAARAAGLSYGQYVGLVLERKCRLTWIV